VDVELLGPVRVLVDGREIDLGGPRNRALVARLALDAGRPVTATTLIDDLWGDEVPADATNALQSIVSRTRRRLPAEALASTPAGYVLHAENVDAIAAERLVAEGNHQAALSLWQGDPLAGLDGVPFVPQTSARLEELRLGALETTMTERVRAGADAILVSELADLTAAHPYREGLWHAYLEALVGTGNQAEALAAFERLRSRLADDLGADPSPALQELHLSILRGETVSRSRSTARLPAGLTTFVGRDEAITEIGKELEENRLVTIVGPGGAGKTRLAIETARASGFDDVWLAELAPVTDGADVIPTILSAVGLVELTVIDRRSSGQPTDERTRLLEALSDVRGLLVVDNCEHLIDDVAQIVEDVLRHAPRLVVLATSREPLRLVGELSYPLESLAIPTAGVSPPDALGYSAVELFVQRARAVDRAFELDATTLPAVVEICTRLDGQPLALELAAARLRTLTVTQVAARLSDRFRLLTGGSRTALPRHRTLRAVVEWSWDLLDDAERDLIERLAVFPGGISVEGASAVAPDSSDVVGLLDSLVDKSLLVPMRGDEPRFRMLETLREYGVERLIERGIVQQVRTAHLEHFVTFAEGHEDDLRGPDQLDAFAALDQERGNVAAAFRFAVDQQDRPHAARLAAGSAWYWATRGQEREMLSWVSSAMGLPGEADATSEVALHVLTILGSTMGDNRAREAIGGYVERILAITDAGGASGPVVHLALHAIHHFGMAGGRALPETDDPWTLAALALMRVLILDNAGDQADTRALLEEAIDGFRAVGDRWGVATAISQRGSFEASAGETEAALMSWEEALPLLEMLGAEDDVQFSRLRIIGLRLSNATEADLPELRADIENRVREAEASGSGRSRIITRLNLAGLERVEGHPERTIDILQGLLDHAEHGDDEFVGSRQMLAAMHAALVLALVDDDRLDEAAEHLDVAASAALASDDMPIVSSVAVASACLAHATGDPVLAARRLGASDGIRGRADLSNRDGRLLREALRAELGDAGFEAEHVAAAALDRAAAFAIAFPANQ
jgi:predicted ATPase/DNA-binding SARP family transcriptional activator